MPPPQQPPRLIVEVATPETVKILQEENKQLRDQLKLVKAQHDKLHQTVYLFMDKFGELQRSLKNK